LSCGIHPEGSNDTAVQRRKREERSDRRVDPLATAQGRRWTALVLGRGQKGFTKPFLARASPLLK
jgi:hypothetical protein